MHADRKRSYSGPLTVHRATAIAIGATAVSNVVTNRLLRPSLYVPWNVGVAAAMVVVARTSGIQARDLGLDPRDLARGLRAGARGALVVATAYGAVLRTRLARDIFEDARVTELSRTTALWHLFVRIPLGTALAEEVIFRGVLSGLLASSLDEDPKHVRTTLLPPGIGGGASSVLFGLWHVLPSLEIAKANVAVRRAVHGRAAHGVALAVGVSTLAGFGLHLLRQRSGHVVAPVLVHLVANTLGFLIARLRRET